ncbi:MAG: MFS transporter [Chloroflexota bacterium]|nr:MFS transporter [Chloroflexota bacterium]
MARTALGLFVVALGLRPQIVGIGPLLPQIQLDLAISHAVAGLLAAIPVLCMGAFAPIGPWFGRLLGTERAIAAGVAAICVFGILRALAPDAASVLLLTFGVGVGIALVGPLLPLFVRHRAPSRAASATGVYAGGIVLGATVAAALAVPLSGPELDWRRPLLIMSLATVASLVAWLLLERPPRPATQASDERPPRLPWTSPLAWGLAIIFAAQSTLFYAANAWLPTVYVERGWTEAEGGFLLALLNGIGIVTTFAAPALAERRGSRREQLALSAAGSVAGLVGIALVPEIAVLWVIVLGIGLGAVFPLALTLPVDISGRARDVAGLAAIMLLGGYGIASVSPFLFGVVRDATGGFAIGLWLLVGVGLVLLAAVWFFVPTGLGRRSGAATVS